MKTKFRTPRNRRKRIMISSKLRTTMLLTYSTTTGKAWRKLSMSNCLKMSKRHSSNRNKSRRTWRITWMWKSKRTRSAFQRREVPSRSLKTSPRTTKKTSGKERDCKAKNKSLNTVGIYFFTFSNTCILGFWGFGGEVPEENALFEKYFRRFYFLFQPEDLLR